MAISKNYWVNKYSQEIGESYTKLTKRAYKKLMFKLIKQLNLDICYRCQKKIENYKELSVDHKISHATGKTEEDRKILFYDLNNIAFSHLLCNVSYGNAHSGDNNFVGVNRYTAKGVNQKYRCAINLSGVNIKFGKFDTMEECAKIFDLCVMKYRGGFGALNYIDKRPEYEDMIKNGWSCQEVERKLTTKGIKY